MRVSGPGSPSPASPGRGADRIGGAAAFPALGGATGTAAGGPAAAAPATAALGMLLALQSLPDATERRRRALRRGWDMLDRLDQLHLGLLEGSVAPSVLDGLHLALTETARDAGDRSLRLLLAEVEVRVAVELAKLEPAGGQR